jgi:hypothetical protein
MPGPSYRKKIRMNTVSRNPVRTSPIVVAVVIAPWVMAAWLSWIAPIASSMNVWICSARSCSGPVVSQSRIRSRLATTWDCRRGSPLTKVMITKVSSPPRTAMPATITITAATQRGTPHLTSRPTPGAISAASNSAIAIGTIRCEK